MAASFFIGWNNWRLNVVVLSAVINGHAVNAVDRVSTQHSPPRHKRGGTNQEYEAFDKSESNNDEHNYRSH